MTAPHWRHFRGRCCTEQLVTGCSKVRVLPKSTWGIYLWVGKQENAFQHLIQTMPFLRVHYLNTGVSAWGKICPSPYMQASRFRQYTKVKVTVLALDSKKYYFTFLKATTSTHFTPLYQAPWETHLPSLILKTDIVHIKDTKTLDTLSKTKQKFAAFLLWLLSRHDTQEVFENAKYVLADLICMKEWWHPVATCDCFYLQFTTTSISKQSFGRHQRKGSVSPEIQLQFHTDKCKGVRTVEDSTLVFRKIPILF